MAKAKSKKSTVKVTAGGYANIHATFNNTIITITNLDGQTVAWASAGKMGFKGTKKSTPYAAAQAARECAENALKRGMQEIIVRIKGLGKSRESAVRALGEVGLRVTKIQDRTPLKHNGCRPPKQRKP